MLRATVFSLGVMLATQVILCATVIGNAALFLMTQRDRPSLIRTIFAAYVVCTAAWAFTIYINLFLKSAFVEEWIFATAAGMLGAQFWFAKIYPEGKLPRKIGEYWVLAVAGFFVLTSFYPGALFTSLIVHPSGYTTLGNGSLSIVYSLFALVYVCAPLFVYFRKFRRQPDARLRDQLRYLTIGYGMFVVVAVLTNSVLPVFFQIYTFNAIGPSFSLVFASAAFFITWKYRFLDIRKAIQRGAIYTFLIASMLVAYTALLIGAERYLESIQLFSWVHADDVFDPLTAVLVTAFGIVLLPSLEHFFQKITDRIFYKDRYDYALALESLSKTLAKNADFDLLIEQIQENLADVLRAESVEVVFSNDESHLDLRERYAMPLNAHEALFEPIISGSNEIGAIVVREKRSGDRYTSEDARLLRTFSMQASTALARAQLFMQVRRHASELEEKVAERTEELRRAREGERQMMLDIAHGLQTPLAVVATKLEQFADSGEPLEIRPLQQSLENLSGFVADLLKLAHFEYAPVLCLQDLDLSEFVAGLCDEVEIIAEAQGMRLLRKIEPIIIVEGDARELRLAIMNLISNAVKYMRRDGLREIRVLLAKDEDSIILSIGDSGVGISQSDLPRIFDRFYRATVSGERGGGLGLAITKAILDRHGASIEASSRVGEGTTMVVRFPLKKAASAA